MDITGPVLLPKKGTMDTVQTIQATYKDLQGEHILCESCGYLRRVSPAHPPAGPCPHCGAGPSHMRRYFPPSIYTLISLMRTFYGDRKDQDHAMLSVVLSFCSFTELLLENFLINRMMRMRIPPEMRERILQGSPYMTQRLEKLFPILTGRQWGDALNQFHPQQSEKFRALNGLYHRLSQAKTLFLHRGNRDTLAPEMPQEAVNGISDMLEMFAALHEKYIFQAASGETGG